MNPIYFIQLNVLVVFFLVFFGCNNNTNYLHDFDKNNWNFKDTVAFKFNIPDSSETKHITFFLRNTLEYPYQNIFLMTTISHKGSIVQNDTAEYMIADKFGKWLGRGFGENRDNYFIFNEKMSFENSGEYVVTIGHGMRKNPLVGINKIGLKIQ